MFSQVLLSAQFPSRSESVKVIRHGPGSGGRDREVGLSVRGGEGGCGKGVWRRWPDGGIWEQRGVSEV